MIPLKSSSPIRRLDFSIMQPKSRFSLALFFSPLIAMVGSCPPITAPALTIVGVMMMQNVSKIDWKDYTESIPAFLIIIGIPLSYSIADGLSLGFISYPIIKALSGHGREVSWLTYLLALVLLLYLSLSAARWLRGFVEMPLPFTSPI
jgi:xanthine/uracil/vitamin C permease (AzgA family)